MKKFTLLAATALMALPIVATPIVSSAATTKAVTTSAKVAKKSTAKTYSYTIKSHKTLKNVAYHTMDKNGNFYKGTLMADRPTLKLKKSTTLYKIPKQTLYAKQSVTVKLSNKKTRTYLYVTSKNKKIAGWTAAGYLKKGIYMPAAN